MVGHFQWTQVAVAAAVWRGKEGGGNLAVAVVGSEVLASSSSLVSEAEADHKFAHSLWWL